MSEQPDTLGPEQEREEIERVAEIVRRVSAVPDVEGEPNGWWDPWDSRTRQDDPFHVWADRGVLSAGMAEDVIARLVSTAGPDEAVEILDALPPRGGAILPTFAEYPWQPDYEIGKGPGDELVTAIALTLSEAAAACGTSRSRIRRLLDAGAFPNAFRATPEGHRTNGPASRWYVPVPDMLAAGLMPTGDRTGANSPETVREQSSGQATGQGAGESGQSGQATGQVPLADLVALQYALDLEREKRKAAESIAAERERTIEGLERALRLLEARNPTAPEPGEPVTPSQGPQDPTAGNPTGDIGEGPAGAPAAPGESVSWWARLRARMSG